MLRGIEFYRIAVSLVLVFIYKVFLGFKNPANVIRNRKIRILGKARKAGNAGGRSMVQYYLTGLYDSLGFMPYILIDVDLEFLPEN